MGSPFTHVPATNGGAGLPTASVISGSASEAVVPARAGTTAAGDGFAAVPGLSDLEPSSAAFGAQAELRMKASVAPATRAFRRLAGIRTSIRAVLRWQYESG